MNMTEQGMILLLILAVTGLFLPVTAGESAAELTFIGHASFKIKTNTDRVIYIDPYAGNKADYAEPADLVLVTHGHGDHSNTNMVTQKPTCKIFSGGTTMAAGDSADAYGIKIVAVEAYNKNHPKGSGVGFVLDMNGRKLYHSGDTDNIPEMKALTACQLDVALLCIDSKYNMSPAEATEAAEIIQAKKSIPMHAGFSPEEKQKNSEAFQPGGKLIISEGDSIEF